MEPKPEKNKELKKSRIYTSASLSDFEELIPSEKYLYKEYTVQTEDGYILKLFRIQSIDQNPEKDEENTEKKKEFKKERHPIVLMHGLSSDSVSRYLVNDRDLALGFILADNSFDVWFGNNRGTRFCRDHATLSSESPDFWEYSFDQLAEFDLPATLGFVSKQSGGRKVVYFGYSQGCTQMIAALADKNYRKKVKPYLHSVMGFAPAVFFNHTESRTFVQDFQDVVDGCEKAGEFHTELGAGWDKSPEQQADAENQNQADDGDEVHLKKRSFEEIQSKRMSEEEIDTVFKNLKIYNLKKETINWSRYPVLLSMRGSGTSKRAWKHFSQLMNSSHPENNTFRKFDFGSVEANQKEYGAPKPPLYDLGLVEERITFWIGLEDSLTYKPDMEDLKAKMSNSQTEMIYLEGWGHSGVCIGPRGPFHDQIVPKILEHLEQV